MRDGGGKEEGRREERLGRRGRKEGGREGREIYV